MPVVTVYGLPADMGEESIQLVYQDLELAFLSVEEMAVTKDMLTFRFPADRMMLDLGKEITITVIASRKPERTDEVRARLAEALGKEMKTYFPEAEVEVLILPFEREWGFWLSSEHE